MRIAFDYDAATTKVKVVKCDFTERRQYTQFFRALRSLIMSSMRGASATTNLPLRGDMRNARRK